MITLWDVTESSSSFCPYVGLDNGWRESCLSRSSWLWELELDYSSRLSAFVSDRSPVHPCALTEAREAPTGLGVIGGNTMNLVGLGGCKAECKSPSLLLDPRLTPWLRLPRWFTRILCQPCPAKPYCVAWSFPRGVSPKFCRLTDPLLMGD